MQFYYTIQPSITFLCSLSDISLLVSSPSLDIRVGRKVTIRQNVVARSPLPALPLSPLSVLDLKCSPHRILAAPTPSSPPTPHPPLTLHSSLKSKSWINVMVKYTFSKSFKDGFLCIIVNQICKWTKILLLICLFKLNKMHPCPCPHTRDESLAGACAG